MVIVLEAGLAASIRWKMTVDAFRTREVQQWILHRGKWCAGRLQKLLQTRSRLIVLAAVFTVIVIVTLLRQTHTQVSTSWEYVSRVSNASYRYHEPAFVPCCRDKLDVVKKTALIAEEHTTWLPLPDAPLLQYLKDTLGVRQLSSSGAEWLPATSSLDVDERQRLAALDDTQNLKHNETLVLLYVNNRFRDFTLNWLCYARRSNVSRYLFVAEDSGMRDYLQNLGEPVWLLPRPDVPQWKGLLPNETDITQSFRFDTLEYRMMMARRTLFVNQFLAAGYRYPNFELSSANAIVAFSWLMWMQCG